MGRSFLSTTLKTGLVEGFHFTPTLRSPSTLLGMVSKVEPLQISGNPFIGELAGLVKEQYFIYVRHQLRPIDAKDTFMPSTAFSGGLAKLPGRTT